MLESMTGFAEASAQCDRRKRRIKQAIAFQVDAGEKRAESADEDVESRQYGLGIGKVLHIRMHRQGPKPHDDVDHGHRANKFPPDVCLVQATPLLFRHASLAITLAGILAARLHYKARYDDVTVWLQ